MSVSSLVIIFRVLCIVHLIACYCYLLLLPIFLIFICGWTSSIDYDDENITIQKQRHSKSVSKNVHTKRFLRCKVWQSGWDLLKMTAHSKKPDSKKLMAPPPDSPLLTFPSCHTHTLIPCLNCVYISSLSACIPLWFC